VDLQGMVRGVPLYSSPKKKITAQQDFLQNGGTGKKWRETRGKDKENGRGE